MRKFYYSQKHADKLLKQDANHYRYCKLPSGELHAYTITNADGDKDIEQYKAQWGDVIKIEEAKFDGSLNNSGCTHVPASSLPRLIIFKSEGCQFFLSLSSKFNLLQRASINSWVEFKTKYAFISLGAFPCLTLI